MQIITGPILIGHPDDPFIGTVSRLHDPVPVVTGGDAEEREEGHAERAKVRVLPEALARVVFIAACEAEGIFRSDRSDPISRLDLPKRPNISTPKAAKMKKRRKNKRPRLPTWGRACITVSSSARIPLAILSSLSTEN